MKIWFTILFTIGYHAHNPNITAINHNQYTFSFCPHPFYQLNCMDQLSLWVASDPLLLLCYVILSPRYKTDHCLFLSENFYMSSNLHIKYRSIQYNIALYINYILYSVIYYSDILYYISHHNHNIISYLFNINKETKTGIESRIKSVSHREMSNTVSRVTVIIPLY